MGVGAGQRRPSPSCDKLTSVFSETYINVSGRRNYSVGTGTIK